MVDFSVNHSFLFFMSFFENLLEFILYFILFLYYLLPEILIITITLLILFFLLYHTKTRNGKIGLKILAFIQNFYISRMKNKYANTHKSRYTSLSKRPRVINTLLPIMLVLIIGFLIYTQVIFFAIVTSDSMRPTFKKNDLVLMQGFSIEPEEGDIIMFDTKEALIPVTHRIVSINSGRIKTKGDARKIVDEWIISKDNINAEAIIYNSEPIVVKDVGSYFLFDPSKSEAITSFGGDEFYKFSEFLKVIKKFGLVIFILCILAYLFLAARDFNK